MTESAPTADEASDLPETTSVVGWLELFFDLVVVAAIAVLTEGLREDPTGAGIGMFLLLYGAIWLTWTSVVLYANVAKVSTRTRTVVFAMFLVAVMAASAPSHFQARANAFAIGFLVVRGVVAASTRHTGKILTSWPLLQFGGLATPWLIAMWVPTPWKFWLWAFGLVVDLVGTVARGDDDGDETVAELQRRLSRRRQPSRNGGRRPIEPVRLVSVDIDTTHLDERLGIFVIIVLGEAVSQLVFAAAGVDWTGQFLSTAVACFAILIGLCGSRSRTGSRPPHTLGSPHCRRGSDCRCTC